MKRAIAGLGLCLLTGCASTVQVTHDVTSSANAPTQNGDGGQSSSGLATSAPTTAVGTSTGAVGGVGQAGGTGDGSATGSQGAAGTSGAGGASSSLSGPSSVGPVSGRGFTARTVTIGFAYLTGQGQAAASFGVSAQSFDPKPLIEQLVKQYNAQGGIAGRAIVPVYYPVDASQAGANPSQTEQRICTAFTQDHPVFAAATIAGQACLTQHKVPTVTMGALNPTDSREFASKAPYLYDPNIMQTDALGPLLVQRLMAKGWLTKASKIGLYYGDDPVSTRIFGDLQRYLTSKGLTVARTYAYDSSSGGAVASAAGGAVLPFRSAGVDRVISYTANLALFMTAAESQGYRPQYALSSYLRPAAVLSTVPPKAQLTGAVGVGWQPAGDVSSSATQSLPGTAACRKAFAASGQSGYTADIGGAAGICDAVSLIVQGTRTGDQLTVAGLRSGLTKLGAAFPTALNLRSPYGLGRYDGALAVRDLAYVASCSCFQYTSRTLYS